MVKREGRRKEKERTRGSSLYALNPTPNLSGLLLTGEGLINVSMIQILKFPFTAN